ncbi:MAG: hypothetical protein AAGA80_04155 [Cyanobacteria bacterium P01_F01_bin.143]
MNYSQIGSGFLDLLKDLDPDSQAKQDLPQLVDILESLDDDQSDAIADAIVDWCAAHQPLGENLRIVALRRPPTKANQANEEQIKYNISLKMKIKQKIQENQEQKSDNSQTYQNS